LSAHFPGVSQVVNTLTSHLNAASIEANKLTMTNMRKKFPFPFEKLR